MFFCRPSARWDSSATLFLHKLLQGERYSSCFNSINIRFYFSWNASVSLTRLLKASTLKEAVLLEPESDSTPIKLYVTIGDIKVKFD